MNLTTQERVQILYEISLSFGTSFDLKTLFKESVIVFLKKLNATAALIYEFHEGSCLQMENVYATPRNAKNNPAYELFLKMFHEECDLGKLRLKSPGLVYEENIENIHYYVFSLGEYGVFILIKKESKLSYEMGKDLQVILAKFTNSIQACLGMQELQNRKIEAESLLKQAQQASRSKSEFLANMSHEIRTPLNAINGFIQILQEIETDEKKARYLNIISQSSNNLLDIINDILDFSKIESGKLTTEYIDFQPVEEFDVISKLFTARAFEKGITLHINYNDIPKYLNSDILKIKQVINNLLSNSIKFTPNNKNIYLSIKYENEKLFISVRDEGIGIDREKFDHIFKAFSQEDASTTRKYGGTGLGLSISSRLVEILGGELKLKSRVGEGSEFYFEIPVKLGSAVDSMNEDVVITALQGHVLLAEDNYANQLFMNTIFEKFDLTFDLAEDGLLALEMFKKDKYDLVLMDENMPNMNGVEATKHILEYEKEHGLKHTPIIALTANAFKGDREKFLEAGMDDYVAKPVKIKQLFLSLSKVLSVHEEKSDALHFAEETTSSFPKFEHLDTAYGLSLVMGMERAYKQILTGLLHYKDIDYQALDDEEFKRTMHSLKGLCASAGAKELSKEAKEIEETLGRDRIGSFAEKLALVLDEIEEKLIEKNEAEKELISQEKRDELFDALKEALKTKRAKKCKPIIDEIEQYQLQKNDAKLFASVKKFTDKFKFKEAQELF